MDQSCINLAGMSDPAALPRYVQIAEMLIREIASGRLAEGERLPPERTMAAELGIAVGTLRQALADLVERDLIERRQGSGNYVRGGADRAGIYGFFRLELADGGGLPTAEILSIGRRAKPPGAPEFGPSADAHRIRRLRRLSGRAVALEEIWLDGARADALGEVSESLYLHYRQALGLLIVRVEDRVGLGFAPDWAPGPAPRAGAPCGHVERVAWAQDGTKVEYSRTWFDAEAARYVARLR
jgi:GntR family transcriptional regulator